MRLTIRLYVMKSMKLLIEITRHTNTLTKHMTANKRKKTSKNLLIAEHIQGIGEHGTCHARSDGFDRTTH